MGTEVTVGEFVAAGADVGECAVGSCVENNTIIIVERGGDDDEESNEYLSA